MKRCIIMNIYICVGSSCHIKGSYEIIRLLKEAITERSLENEITLSASFCLGHCTNGVTVKVNDKIICGVSEDNFQEFLETEILSQIK